MSDAPRDAHHETAEPDSIDAIALDRKRRSRRLLIGGAVALVVVVGGGAALLFAQEQAANKQISESFGALSRCLLGPPLEAGEAPSTRFRRLQMAGMTMGDAERAPANNEPWPTRCAALGHGLSEALNNAGRAKKDGPDLASWSETLAKALKEKDAFSADLSEPIENVWHEAAASSVSPAMNIDVPPPPPLPTPLDVTSLASTKPLSKSTFPLQALFTEPHAGPVLKMLVDDKGAEGAPFWCTYARTDSAIACKSLPAAITSKGQGLRLLGTSDEGAAPLIFAGNRGDHGIFRADTGEQVEALYSYGGFVADDGFAASLGFREETRELALTRRPPGGPSGRKIIVPDFDVGNYFYSSQILWENVLFRAINEAEERRLYVQKLNRTGAPLAHPVDVGELPEPGLVVGGADEPPHIAGCKTKDALAIRVKGYDNDFLTMLVAGKPSKPVSPELTGGTLGCFGTTATITRLEPAGTDNAWKTTVSQVICDTAGCRGALVPMEPWLHGRYEFAPREGLVDAVSLGNALVVAWAAGDRGGVRMRIGAADRIAKEPDILVFDDLVKDGQSQKLSTLFGLRLLSREGFALLILSTLDGVFALRVDADGKVTPVPATRD